MQGARPRMPFIGPSDAALSLAMISSYVASLARLTVRSTTDTSSVGTRNDMPVSLPFSSGSTCARARAQEACLSIFHVLFQIHYFLHRRSIQVEHLRGKKRTHGIHTFSWLAAQLWQHMRKRGTPPPTRSLTDL
jgi:hypothetical protein